VGLVLGTRARSSSPGLVSAVMVFKTIHGNYTHWQVIGNEPEYYADKGYSLEMTGLALADVDGDGNTDIISASYLSERLIDPEHPIQHSIMLVDHDPSDDLPLRQETVFSSGIAGRTVSAGNLFDESELPDLVYGMVNGELIFFANQGLDSNGDFAGFVRKGKIQAGEAGCTIRDIEFASLSPCTRSVVAALTCGSSSLENDNYLFTSAAPCSTDPPSHSAEVAETATLEPSTVASDSSTTQPTQPLSLTEPPSNSPSGAPSVLPSLSDPTSAQPTGAFPLTSTPSNTPSDFPTKKAASPFPSIMTTEPTMPEPSGLTNSPSNIPSSIPTKKTTSPFSSTMTAEPTMSQPTGLTDPPSNIPSNIPSATSRNPDVAQSRYYSVPFVEYPTNEGY